MNRGLIADFGCGIARISKKRIQQKGCRATGADIRMSMQSQVLEYFNDARSTGLSPDLLIRMLNNALKAGGAILIWVLQHIPQPQKQLQTLSSLLEKDGKLFISNKLCSALSIQTGWIDSKRISENSLMAGCCSKENV